MTHSDSADATAAGIGELSLIFNSTQDALFLLLEEAGHLHYCFNNDQHRLLTGCELDALNGRTPQQVLGEAPGAHLEAMALQCLNSGSPVSFEEALSFSGTERTLLTKLTPILRPGSARMVVGSRVDITRITQLLREKDALHLLAETSLGRFRSMFTAHTAVMLLLDPCDGKIMDANPAASEFYGYSHDELTGMAIQDINTLSPAEIEAKRMQALARSQKYFLFPHRLKSGEIRLVEVYSCPVEVADRRLLYSIVFDVTERERNREEFDHERELLDITLQSIGDGVVATGLDNRIVRINSAALDMLDCERDAILGRLFGDVVSLADESTGTAVQDLMQETLRRGHGTDTEWYAHLTTRSGRHMPVAVSAAPIQSASGETRGAVLVFRDVSAEHDRKKRMLYLSNHDTLTGLFNRRYFHEEEARIDSPRAWPLSIVMGDVNGLKLTNDVFGHEAGDSLLRIVSQMIRENLSEKDIAIRWGGDEFVLFLSNTDRAAAERLVEKLHRLLSAQSILDVVRVSVSFGIATKESATDDLSMLLKDAEEAMYRIKMQAGRALRDDILALIVSTLDERSTETSAHSSRLEQHCALLAAAKILKPDELNELCRLCDFHDIGLIGVDSRILQKPGPLDESEWSEIRRHPETGYRIAQNLPELSTVSNAILCHHERWDGTGYPRGLKGEQIPLSCRILAIADAYDAMVSDRVYRERRPPREALLEIQRCAGTQFDPELSAIFIEAMSSSEGHCGQPS